MPQVTLSKLVDGEETAVIERMVTVMIPNEKVFYFFTVDYDAKVCEELPLVNLADADPLVIPSPLLLILLGCDS